MIKKIFSQNLLSKFDSGTGYPFGGFVIEMDLK